MAVKSWYKITLPQAKAGERVGEITIYEEIGFWGVTAAHFYTDLTSLMKVSDKIRLRINSPGGDLFSAITIYNMLKEVSKLEVVIDGVAASAASLIAMAGNPVIMPENAFMMIHLPQTGSFGNASKLREDADLLDKLLGSLVRIYAGKTGLKEDEITSLLGDETWLSAEEAVKLGFADEISATVKIAARAEFRKYAHVPQSLIAAVPPPNKESVMTEPNPPAATVTAAIPQKTEAEIRAEVTAARKGQTAEIVALCRIAGRVDLASSFLVADASVEDVRAALLKLADEEDEEEVKTTLPKNKAAADKDAPQLAPNLNPTAVYAKWNASLGKARR